MIMCTSKNVAENKDVNSLICERKFDVVYLDPPYNQRQYSGNYSPLNYVALYDDTVEVKGKTGLIEGYNKSAYCSKIKVKRAFIDLINNLSCNHILLSYNDEGLLKLEELREILEAKGRVWLYKIKYNKFKAQTGVKKEFVYEYLWYVDVGKEGETEEVFMDLIKNA
jgi:adenine-specific DNA-methyltransferase